VNNPKLCGRITRHLAHHWGGIHRVWDEEKGRWFKPVYWCKGHVQIEGGHRGVH
jgi:hypothetical protein